jgi:uncharacterized membrane protein YcaP (DUF421 family)
LDGVWYDLWHLQLPAGEKVIRTIAVYAAIVALLRIFGKRQLAQLNALDLVVLLLLSNVVQNAIIGPDNSLSGGLLGAATLLVVNYGLVRLTFRHDRLSRLVQGKQTLLVDHGEPQAHELEHELITQAELEAVLRREGIDGIRDVATVTLEPEGTITPVRKPQPGIREVLERLDRIEQKLG